MGELAGRDAAELSSRASRNLIGGPALLQTALHILANSRIAQLAWPPRQSAAHFRPLRIDGEDYRHRGLPEAPAPYSEEAVTKAAYATPGASLDDFPHLKRWHAAVALRPAVARAYAMAARLSVQPAVSDEESRRVLFGQSKDTVR